LATSGSAKLVLRKAAKALEDPYQIHICDEPRSVNEDRYAVLGSADGRALL
jgi:uncharacterized DUF497 family protein